MLTAGTAVNVKVAAVAGHPRLRRVVHLRPDREQLLPGGKRASITVPREEWISFIPGAHPGYITLGQWEANIARLAANAAAHGRDRAAGPPREGPALLQGIIICGRCGGRMTIRYHARGGKDLPTYLCQRDGIDNARPICAAIPGHTLDERIGQLLIAALTPLAVEAALQVSAELQQRAAEADALRAAHVERARYHADLARRRDRAVDPANRLVAGTLEAGWNTALRALNDAQAAYDKAREQHDGTLTPAQKDRISQLVTDLPGIWNDPATPMRERKRIARLLLTDVTGYEDLPHGAALFESILVFDNYDLNSKMQAQGGNWAHRRVHLRERTNFPLTLYGYADQKLILRLAYDRGRFNAASILRTLGHLKTILEAISVGVDGPLSSVSMLTAAEQRQLNQWNNTQTDYPRTKCIHHLIEEQAGRSPGVTALVFRDRRLTYRELDNRANQLAHLLRSKGLRPGDRVAVSMDRCLDLMVALLATLKAGGAYVPLDPSYPAERMKYVLSDAHVPIILTQAKLLPQVAGFAPIVLAVDAEHAVIDRCSQASLEDHLSSDNLAYVIYTSGSTGKPKGVMVMPPQRGELLQRHGPAIRCRTLRASGWR